MPLGAPGLLAGYFPPSLGHPYQRRAKEAEFWGLQSSCPPPPTDLVWGGVVRGSTSVQEEGAGVLTVLTHPGDTQEQVLLDKSTKTGLG